MKKTIISLVTIPFLLSCGNDNNNGLTQIDIYFDLFSAMEEKMNQLQSAHQESEKYLFEIPNVYGCKATYGIRGVCYCPIVTSEHISHVTGEECTNLYYREPYFRLSLSESEYSRQDNCIVHYLDKGIYDNETIRWDEKLAYPDSQGEISWPNEYVLKDSSGFEIVKVECFNSFTQVDKLLSDIVELIKNKH